MTKPVARNKEELKDSDEALLSSVTRATEPSWSSASHKLQYWPHPSLVNHGKWEQHLITSVRTPSLFYPVNTLLNWYLFVSVLCRSEPPMSWCSIRHWFLHKLPAKRTTKPKQKRSIVFRCKGVIKLLIRKALPPGLFSHPILSFKAEYGGVKYWGFLLVPLHPAPWCWHQNFRS